MTDRQKSGLQQTILVAVTAVASAVASYNGSSQATEATLDNKVDRVEFMREVGRLEGLIRDEGTRGAVVIERLDALRDEVRELGARIGR